MPVLLLDISKNYSYRLVVRALALILGTVGDVYYTYSLKE
jgi:hypothetical protein